MRINTANRIGMPALGAARMEEEIVKVPKDQIVVAFRRSQAFIAARDLEENLAVDQKAEKLDTGEARLAADIFDFLRGGQTCQRGRNFRVADFKQRARARRFQNHLVSAPTQ